MTRSGTNPGLDSRDVEMRTRMAGLAALAVALVAAGTIFALVVVPRTRESAIDYWRRDLTLRAELRASAIDSWISDRFADARVVATFPSVAAVLAGESEAGRPGQLVAILTDVAREKSLEAILVVSASGELVRASRGTETIDPACAELAVDGARKGTPAVGFRNVFGRTRVVIVVPVAGAGNGAQTAGTVLLLVDPERWLYPFMQQLPATMASSEALLMVRDGSSALLLTPLRFRSGPPLSVRLPLNTPGLAATTALTGGTEFSRYVDYRGVPIYAATRMLASAPWGLVVKVDESEVLAEARARSRTVGVVMLLSCLLAALTVAQLGRLWGRTARKARQRDLERIALLLEATNDVILFVTGDGAIRDANLAAERIYGWPREALLRMSISELRSPAARENAADDLQRVMHAGQLVFSTEHANAAGEPFPVEVSARAADIDGRSGCVAVIRDIRERLANEARFARLNLLLRTIVDRAPASICAVDRTGRVTLWNPASEALFGWREDEVIGRRLPTLDAEQRNEFEERFVQTLSGEPPAVATVHQVRKDGSSIDLLMSLELLRDERAEAVGALSVAIDQTAARKAEERARALFESNVIGCLLGDIHGSIHEANDTFLRIIGYSREELASGAIRWDAITPEEWLPLDMERVAEARREGRCRPYEKEYVKKDGSRVPVLVGFQLLEPERERSVAFILDISTLKHEQRARHRAESALVALFETPVIPIAILDSDGDDFIVAECNVAYARRHARDLEQVRGARISELGGSPESLAADIARAEALASRGGTEVYESALAEADGVHRYVVSMTTLPSPSRNGVRALLVMTDVTPLRAAEDELRRLNAELEERVAARTAELVAANKELEAFSYSVSHDLRAPLRAIDGFSRLIEDEYMEQIDDEGRRLLGVIRTATRGMGRLIDDLLAFSRAGRQPIQRTVVPMKALVNAAWHDLPEDRRAGVTFLVGELPDANGDASLLRQVWQNLLDNALKYSAQRPDRRIEVGFERDAGRTIWFVRDSGVGFDMEYASMLFGVFQRLHSSHEFEGTGVGLALVQRIVRRHGGDVRGEGEPGVGATFSFTLEV